MSLLFSNASRFSYSTSRLSSLPLNDPVKPQLRLPTHPPNVLYVNSQRRMYDTDRKFACEPGTRCAPKAFVLFNFTSSQASTAATSGPSLQSQRPPPSKVTLNVTISGSVNVSSSLSNVN